MKYRYLLTFVILTIGMIMISCKDAESERIRREARAALPEVQPGTVAPPPAPSSPVSASTSLEPHYKCPNNCVGGTGSTAGSCPVCGAELAHNTAYHNQSASTTPPAPGATPQSPAAATNTAGVFHYTCSNGCAGGAASQGVCATCGATLVHNTAYHSQSASPAAGTTSPTITPQTVTPTTSAQNASGVFHYTCSNGCAGGAASAVACATCGATLVHNTAYHN